MSPVGAMIMGIFAGVWWVLGIVASGHRSVPLYAVPLLITGAIIVVALRRSSTAPGESPEESARVGRLVGIASGVEGILIFVAINVLTNIGKRDFFAPVVAVIVGLHFLPLAHLLPARLYYATAALLVVLGIVGFVMTDVSLRILLVSLGAASVLWLTSTVVLVRRP